MRTSAERRADYLASYGANKCATCERLTVGKSKYCREHRDKEHKKWKERASLKRVQLEREGLI